MFVPAFVPRFVRFFPGQHEPDYLEHLLGHGYDGVLVASLMLHPLKEDPPKLGLFM